MASSVKYPTANTATTGFNGIANNPTNAYTDDATEADFAPSKPRNDEDAHCWSGFDFSAIPVGSTIDSVVVKIGVRMSASNGSGQWRATIWADATSGSSLTDVTATNSIGGANYTRATTDTTQFIWDLGTLNTVPTLAQLQAAGFGIRVEAAQGNNGTSYTYFVDYIEITVNYTENANNFDETGRTVAITATVSSTDDHYIAYDETGLTVAIVATVDPVLESHNINGGDLGIAKAFGGASLVVAEGTGTNYDETGRTVAVVATVASTDLQDTVEDVAVPIVATVTSSDSPHAMLEDTSVAVVATVTSTDDHTVAGVNYDETGRAVSVVATVSSIETQAHDEATGLTVPVVVTVTSTDVFTGVLFDETGRLVAIVASVSSTDVQAHEELAGSVPIVVIVTSTDDFTGVLFDETGRLVSIVVTVTSADTQAHEELARVVAGVVTVTSTDSPQAMVEDVAVAITATISVNDSQGGNYTELARLVPIVATVSSTDAQARSDDVAIAIATSVTSTDSHALVELALPVAIVTTVTSTDDYDDYTDETGRPVSILATVTSTDQQAMAESINIAGVATVISADTQAMGEDVSVAIVATVTSTDETGGAYIETGRPVAIVATITSTDSHTVGSTDVAIVAVSAMAKAVLPAHGVWQVVTTGDIVLPAKTGFATAFLPAHGYWEIISDGTVVTTGKVAFAKAFNVEHDPVQDYFLYPAAGLAKAFGGESVVNDTGSINYDETGRTVTIIVSILVWDSISTINETGLAVEINVTVTSTDSWWNSTIGGGGIGTSTEGGGVGYSGESTTRGKSAEVSHRGKSNSLQSLGRTT